MRVKVFVHTIILLVLTITQVSCKQQPITLGSGEIEFIEQGLKITVEIAETDAQKSKGLMFREGLVTNNGMLFVYQQERRLSVWMKNTGIPLDILFISELGVIVSIYNDVQPCFKVSCEIYESKGKAKYFLEINAGVVEKNHISVGQSLKINVFPAYN